MENIALSLQEKPDTCNGIELAVIETRLQNKIAGILEIDPEEIELSSSPSELGFDSLNYVELASFLESEFNLPVTPDLLYECHTISALAEFINKSLNKSIETLTDIASFNSLNSRQEAELQQLETDTPNSDCFEYEYSPQDIAIIGIGISLPQAKTLAEFWQLLIEGKVCIKDFPIQRLPHNSSQETDFISQQSQFLKGGFLDDAEYFDARFFGISPREAELMDPQQRLFLQCVWHAIENAGYRASQLSGSKTAVFVGVSNFDYHELLCQQHNVEPHLATGVSHAVLANRISHLFNFKGPSEAIDTACSSSLVAIHRAVELLRREKCDLAIAGGVNIIASLTPYIAFSKAGMLSKTGECRPFDRGANGYVRGEGAGVLLLKSLERAKRDGDQIYAVIKGAAVGHSGRTNSLTAPAPEAQAEVIIEAYNDAQVSPATIGYIEAHGTGTTLGDPIEINGLKKAFTALYQQHSLEIGSEPNCYIGSVKSNIGHLEAAAGVGGVLKTILALQQGIIPANANFDHLNKYIQFQNSPFQVAQQQVIWERGKYPRRASVSSFGFGGTNAHVVMEEYVNHAQQDAAIIPSTPQLFVLSAKSPERLVAYAKSVAAFLEVNIHNNALENHILLANIAYTLQKGREPMEHRLAILAESVEELYDALSNFIEGKSDEVKIFCGDSKHSNAYDQLFDTEQELTEFWRSLIQGKSYRKLAKLWVAGLSVDWLQVFPKQPFHSVLPLPGYPFSPDRYWIPAVATSVKANSANLVPSKIVKEQVSLLVPQWQQKELQTSTNAGLHGSIIVIANAAAKPVIAQLQVHNPNASLLIIEDGAECERLSSLHYRLCFERAEHRAWLKQELSASVVGITGILDLGSFTDSGSSALGKISLLQALLNELVLLRQPFSLLQLTTGLQNLNGSSTNLFGAEVAGLFKMLGAEYNFCYAKTVDLDPTNLDLTYLCQLITNEWQQYDSSTEICYRDRQRYVATLSEITQASITASETLPKGTVVITGGTGGIGNQIAQSLASQGYKNLVLMGKTALPHKSEWHELRQSRNADPAVISKIENILNLESQGVNVEIYTGNLTDYDALDSYFQEIRRKYGRIAKVFHCAGCVLSETPAFLYKPIADIVSVLTPKIQALNVLHKVFEHDNLDAFVLFSSLSSLVPKLAVGISDYATANAYMNYFAAYQVAQGNTYYRSIQWSNWKDVGIGEVTSKPMADLGLVPLLTSAGLQSLERILALPQHIHAVACLSATDKSNFTKLSLISKSQIANHNGAKLQEISQPQKLTSLDEQSCVQDIEPSSDRAALRNYVLHTLKQIISRELRIAEANIESDASFDALGVDSIFLASIVNKIDEWLSVRLDPSLLLQHDSISRLTEYLVAEHGDNLSRKMPSNHQNERHNAPKPEVSVPKVEQVTAVSPAQPAKAAAKVLKQDNSASTQIAVIGIACKFPGAKNKEIFWNNLVSGVDSVKEVPKSRWDIEQYYSQQFTPGKSVSKWGGFIDDLEYIDPAMFGVSSDEASDIDPLVRLFCQSSVDAVLDSGYTVKDVNNRKVGVFVGARVAGYGERIAVPKKSSVIGVGQNFIAAHVSHYLNLKGPSLVIDTACSSSLMAIHLACQSLLYGESEMALAGGVEVLLDEKPYLFLSGGQALSPDGKCYTFDERANGFVPGEGVGCVLLKPLKQALADGDQIYAVIDATAANNDGHTMGITTPSVEGQVEVIQAALAKANLSPEQISYIETHGTGTMIGDPIELRALSQVFAGVEPGKQCGLGSVKTNIGHLLSAAGVASFIKVVLSLHNQKLVSSLNCDRLNPRFNFSNSPFYPVQQTQAWSELLGCRRAGISSFGFGGTNVHAIVSQAPDLAVKPGIAPTTSGSTNSAARNQVYAWLPAATQARANYSFCTLPVVTVEPFQGIRVENWELEQPRLSLLGLEEITTA